MPVRRPTKLTMLQRPFGMQGAVLRNYTTIFDLSIIGNPAVVDLFRKCSYGGACHTTRWSTDRQTKTKPNSRPGSAFSGRRISRRDGGMPLWSCVESEIPVDCIDSGEL
jgi:hypothetical protein